MRAIEFFRAAPVLPLLLLGGCQWFILGAANLHHMTLERATASRELKQIRVVDVRTNAPVARARIHVVYDFDWRDDWEEDLVTSVDGIANVKAATASARVMWAAVRADGYRPQNRAKLSGLGTQQQVTVLLTHERDAGPAKLE